jgi:nucleotide-binding universal stress UspA family protein
MPSLRRILVPVDFSDCSDAAIEYALFLRGPFDAKVELLHVWESPVVPGIEGMLLVAPPEGAHLRGETAPPNEGPMEASHGATSLLQGRRVTLTEYVRAQAESALRGLLDDLAARGHRGLTGRLAAGDPARAIADVSGEYDLVVMGTHGRGAIGHLLLGSVAEKVVRRAHAPVLTIHAAKVVDEKGRTDP